MDDFTARQDPPIKMNYVAAQEHVPREERNNRVIQERVRNNYHQLPYDTLTRILMKYMVLEAPRKLFFSSKTWTIKILQPKDDIASRKYRFRSSLHLYIR